MHVRYGYIRVVAVVWYKCSFSTAACSTGLGESSVSSAGDGRAVGGVPEELALPRGDFFSRRHSEVMCMHCCVARKRSVWDVTYV